MARRVLLCCGLMDDPRVTRGRRANARAPTSTSRSEHGRLLSLRQQGQRRAADRAISSSLCALPIALPCSKVATVVEETAVANFADPRFCATRSPARCGMPFPSTISRLRRARTSKAAATHRLAREVACARGSRHHVRLPRRKTPVQRVQPASRARRARSASGSLGVWQDHAVPRARWSSSVCRLASAARWSAASRVAGMPVQLIQQHPEQAIDPRLRMRKTLAEAGDVPQELLDNLGIRDEWMQRYPHELSGGELQRFCASPALATAPPALPHLRQFPRCWMRSRKLISGACCWTMPSGKVPACCSFLTPALTGAWRRGK